MDWRRLSRVNVNFENQTFPESLRLLSERSKPPLIPHTRPPTLSLASQPGCKESKERWEVGGSGSILFATQPRQGRVFSLWVPGESGTREASGPASYFLSCQGQDFALAPHSCLPRVKGSLDVRRSPVAFLLIMQQEFHGLSHCYEEIASSNYLTVPYLRDGGSSLGAGSGFVNESLALREARDLSKSLPFIFLLQEIFNDGSRTFFLFSPDRSYLWTRKQ